MIDTYIEIEMEIEIYSFLYNFQNSLIILKKL